MFGVRVDVGETLIDEAKLLVVVIDKFFVADERSHSVLEY